MSCKNLCTRIRDSVSNAGRKPEKFEELGYKSCNTCEKAYLHMEEFKFCPCCRKQLTIHEKKE